MCHTPPADWSLQRQEKYFDRTKKVVAGLCGASPALEALFDRNLNDARERLQTVKAAAKNT
jgi:hypothetical protein